ncbi:MAG: ATP-binding cassette domain-containing protein [Zymomonas mobilis subsp. pomaceae]|uniref:ABC transporter related protein n=1 Tax=Zymomonas mobilis subsp. pomaceae (strain ATCC 29192 / DSM 22645 / JCM 10191 / CCUG 17912 / NBRC 13757 / NCIMB 11200 / NRRL B-4491 / Barker I) TaxID=579138 RepID=F8EUE8_ZYMMT|nr:ATP-binding cassette domain-containing protein [Zymomonas mobilis]AEI37164.1 ABC transporter related protein [Zymomonas mobilis subsp. pomaceae ATCC 29192]MDX5948534.1 ATP-binding cassette domain-containing protein [Zymomonas mobilis subsp. pomaceae]GEB89842.1 ABC transporter ATP-binding protein [Zymomonas mobilis subsp. pomaceae]
MSDSDVIKIRGLKNSFGTQVVHENLDLSVKRGEILGLVGGSGSGKSVLMRSIIGLQKPSAGSIEVLGHEILGQDILTLRMVSRHWGVLFQESALFSTLNIIENIQVPLREYYPDLDQSLLNEIASYKIAMTDLPEEAGIKYNSELSGGMRKRAGLSRALALDPDLLFLDEPTSGLDPVSADAIDALILGLRQMLGLTVFMITHDLDSLYNICDRVAVLADKKVIAIDSVENLAKLDHPWIKRYFNGPRGRAAAESYDARKTGA